MKIAVMGMGVAGSYLMARLKNSEHEVVGYERMVEERHDSMMDNSPSYFAIQSDVPASFISLLYILSSVP